MENKEYNNKQPENSTLNIADVNSSFFKPLSDGTLNELKDKIYKEQFFDYDETANAENVLDALQNLKNNPKLLDYVIKCLAEQKIATVPNKFYCVVVNAELRMEYDEKIHKTFDKYKQFCVDSDFGLKKRDHLLMKVYNCIDHIENEMMGRDGEEIFGFGNTKFQKYTIYEVGVAAK
jgi:hypothetical protein